jgi:hypothetical protein
MWADDLFASIYFAWVKSRLKSATEFEKGRTQHERSFRNWSDTEWNTAIASIEQMLEAQLPAWLDSAIGPSDARVWNKTAAEIPIRLSELRQLLTTGRIAPDNVGKYLPTHFDSAIDVAFLLVFRAVLEAVRARPEYSLRISDSASGVTLISNQGTVRQLIFLYGRSAQNAYSTLSAYINEVEAECGLPAPEVVVIPCQQYRMSTEDDLGPERSDDVGLPSGDMTATKYFVDPDRLFQTGSFSELRAVITEELEL